MRRAEDNDPSFPNNNLLEGSLLVRSQQRELSNEHRGARLSQGEKSRWRVGPAGCGRKTESHIRKARLTLHRVETR